jgi:dUTP pyrophosphatase
MRARRAALLVRRVGGEKKLLMPDLSDSPKSVIFRLGYLCRERLRMALRAVVDNRKRRRAYIYFLQRENTMPFAGVPQDAVAIKVLKLDPAAQLPRYAHTGPFGDLAADLYAVAGVVLEPGATVAVATGVALEFPATHGALVEDRSGLAMRGVTTLAGVIDPGYRGEIKVVVTNLGAVAAEVKAGDRIAQLRIVQRIEARFEEVSELVEAPRGAKGFGSTGS